MKSDEILVLDSEKRFLDYAHPAIARKLLKDGKALLYSKDPFAIQLNVEFSNLIRSGRLTLASVFKSVHKLT